MAGTKPIIAFDHVSMSFGRKTPQGDRRKVVLNDVCLEVPHGITLCLLGPSGCGKTTMVNLIIGNTVPKSGTVQVMEEVAPFTHARKKVGYMPQDDALYIDITAEENLKFFGRLYGIDKDVLQARIDELLDFTRLTDDRKRMVSTFSGGMKRRLSLAVAMLHSPDLLVLDEPTVGLDPAHRRHIWDEFEKLTDAGVSILVTTHVMDEALRCRSIAMLHDGCIVAVGSPEEILATTNTTHLEDAFLALEASSIKSQGASGSLCAARKETHHA